MNSDVISQSISLAKAEIRKDLALFRPTPEACALLRDQLQHFLSQQSGIWAAYFHLPNEVDLSTVTEKTSSIRWAYPKVVGQGLEFFIPKDEGSANLEAGPLGTRHPKTSTSQRVELTDLNGILIPALAYDLGGVRLGRGKGYYDRTLTNFKKQTVGIALREQVFEKLPQEDFDLRVKYLATDRGILKF